MSNMPTGRYSRRADCQRNFWRKGSIINKPFTEWHKTTKTNTNHHDASGG
jgi:hypothetical protein